MLLLSVAVQATVQMHTTKSTVKNMFLSSLSTAGFFSGISKSSDVDEYLNKLTDELKIFVTQDNYTRPKWNSVLYYTYKCHSGCANQDFDHADKTPHWIPQLEVTYYL